ncbi:nucleotide pyrophosphohydrolase [Candidatus Babeliales bacterium]|nr:nucleotide pyrophosphohydrolase [Candidatus Babeliales bacterium]
MNDQDRTVQALKDQIQTFVSDRNWRQYHSPKNLSMAIASEAAELLDIFRWTTEKESEDLLDDPIKGKCIRDELSDVLIALLTFAVHYNIDVSSNFERKLQEICEKYPVKKWRGRSGKYTEDL